VLNNTTLDMTRPPRRSYRYGGFAPIFGSKAKFQSLTQNYNPLQGKEEGAFCGPLHGCGKLIVVDYDLVIRGWAPILVTLERRYQEGARLISVGWAYSEGAQAPTYRP
jgi:hypothetical protein